MQNDYIDFKFGDHWASEFNLLAVSSSDRYTPPIYGSVNPNIATIMGKKGVYKWKTQVNEKIFNISIAFDSVTIAQLNQIKQWLQPNKIQKLIFSEEPYKYYWAALNAEIDFSHLPFVEGEKQVGERTIIEGVYKGEMVISFVCIDNDGYSTEGTFEGLETENPSNTIKGNDFVLTDADNDYIEDLKIEGKSKQETKYNNTLSDTDFADVNSRSVEKAWKTNNLAQIQAENGEVTISAPYQYSGIAQEQREALIDHKYFASAEINTDSLDTALEIAGKNITNSIEGKDINITDGLIGPVDDLVVSGDASQDKLYNNEINSSFLEDLDNWNNQNNGKATISKQKATVTANEKYDGISQYTEENNVGDKYYVRTKVQSNNTETALEVETEKGSAEGSSITINDASDNKLENIRIEGKHSQEHYDQKDLGEGEIISYNNADNYQRYTKVSISGNSAQEVVEEVPGTEVEGESITAQDITLPKGRIGVYGNSKQESRSGKNLFNIDNLINVTEQNVQTGSFVASSLYGTTIINNINLVNLLKPNTNYKCIANVTLLEKPAIITSNTASMLTLYKSIAPANNIPVLKCSNTTEKNNWQVNETKQLETTFTTDNDLSLYNMLCYCYANDTEAGGKFKFENIMILEATEQDETFEPYGATPSPEYSSPIKVLGDNTNLFNALDNFSARTIIGLTVTPISNDSIIKINGTATADTFSFIGNDIMDIFENGKTYYAYTNNENFEVLFELYGTDIEVPIKTVSNFIMSSEYRKINLVLKGTNLNGKTYNNEEIGIKIEEGKITNYTPYGQGSCSFIIANGDKTQKQEFVLPIQKPMLEGDYFDFKKGKEIHNWEKVILDGTEPWGLSTLTNYQWFRWSLSGVRLRSDFICTHLKTYNGIGNSSANYIGITNNSTPDRIYIAISKDITTVEQLKEYLAELRANNNPIVVYYQKTEIEELPLTEEQIEIGEQIAETELFLDTTNIYSNDEIAPNFKLEYNYVLPSPSPEVPSEIQNVGDNINLINENEPLHYRTLGSALDNTVLQANSNMIGFLFECKPNTTYYFSRLNTNGNRFRAFCFDENPVENLSAKSTNGFWNDTFAGGNGLTGSFTTTDNSKYIYLYVSDTLIVDNKYKAELNGFTSYSPYNCGNVDITVCNKNLWNDNSWDIRDVIDGKNVLKFNGYYTSGTGVKQGTPLTFTNKFKKGTTYTVSGKFKKTTYDNQLCIMYTDFSIQYGGKFTDNFEKSSVSITTSSEKEVLYFAIFSGSSSSNSYVEEGSLQLEENSIATEYIEHQQQTITFPLSEGQKLMKGDYLARDGIHHVRKQIELNGTEYWQTLESQNTENTMYFAATVIDSTVSMTNNFILCNIAKQGQVWDSDEGNLIANQRMGVALRFRMYKKDFADLNQWKSFLIEQKEKNMPVIVEYELAEEEIETYTTEQQTAYNNLTHLIMYNGQNILSSSNELKPQLKWEIPESPSPDYPIEINIVGQEDFKVNTSSNNFLDTNNINFSFSALGINVKSNTDGSLKVSGTAIKDGYFAVQLQTEFFKPLKKGTRLTLNFGQNKKLLKDSRLKIFAWTYDKNNVSGGLLNSASPNYSIILSRDVVKITWGIEGFVQGTVYNDNIYITLNSEKEINNYIKNKQQISNIQCKKELLDGDYIDLKTNMEAHTWNYIELDGTENWVSEPGNLVNTFRARVSTGKTSNNYVGKSTHFNFVGNYDLDEPHMYATDAGALYIYINKEIANSLEELKAWLVEQKEKGTPVRVYWKANKTSGTVLTSEQKTELQKLRSYREVTNINSNDILQPNIKIEYIKKPSYTTKLTGNTEQLLSLIYQTNIDKTKILLNNISDNDNSFTFTHPILINLTKQFGSGKEPTKEWLDTNIDFWDVAEGGAPSVETSSRVKTVGGNINLFDPDNHIEFDGQYRGLDGSIYTNSELFGLKIPVLGNTVYSVNSNLSRNQYHNFGFLDKKGKYMWGLIDFTKNNKTFRTPKNCGYVYLAINKNYDWFTLSYGEVPIQKVNYGLANIDMQISGYDNQFKSFPLAEGQELLQLSDGIQDTLEADGIHKRVGKLIVTGNEKWGQYNRQLHTYFGAAARITGTKAPIFCNRLIDNNGYVYNTTGEAAGCLQDGYLYMCIKRKDFGANDSMSVDECLSLFKQFLKDEYSKGNPFIYYYRKAEEEIIPYSNAQKAWYDDFEIYRKNTQITTIAETKPWYSFTYDINDTYSVNSTKVNEYEKLGLIFNNLEDRPRFIVNRTADGSGTIKMRKPLVVDLTNAFGAGKEPDLAWCLENITFDNSCEYGTPSPNVPSELVSVGSNPIKIENKSRNLIKEQNLLNWAKEYCTAERLTEKYDNRNIYRISFENHKKGTISTRIQQKKGNMVLSIYARVIQADDPTVNRLAVAKVTSDSSASTVVSHKSLENLIGEWQKIYIPITSTTISDAAELVLEVQHNADTDDSTVIDLCMPQLEEGFTPHDYIPYAPEKVNNLIFTTPLRQLKNGVRDELSKDGIIRRIGEHTIKSTDTVYWIVFNQDKDYVTICGKLGIYIRGDDVWKSPSFYCNRIEDCTCLYAINQGGGTPSSRTKEGIGIIDSEYRMCLRADLMGIVETDTEEDMIRKYKVLLDEKPFTIYYEKEVADIEPLTELQKNTLANLVTRKQYDHWLVSGDLNPEVELSYKLTSSINDIHPWVTGSNLLDKTWFYNDNNIHTKPYIEVDTGDADKSGISANRPIYLLNSGTETANLSLTFDYINIETPLTIQTYSGKFTDDGFVEEAKVSEITIEPFTNYQPFKDIYDNNPANWKIEIDSALGEVYLRHNTDETKVLNLNRFNKDHTFLSLADCNFVDYDKVFPTIISEIEGTAIENTIFNKVIIANTADNYRLKNVNVEWKHTYL